MAGKFFTGEGVNFVVSTTAKGHGEKASRKREIFIACLLTEPNIREAARKAGISENTGWRWMQDQDFQADYQKARKMAVSQAIGLLQQISTEAVLTLQEVMTDRKATAASRVTAARTVLDTALKAVELEDLAARIERLEQVLEGQQGGKRAWR